MAEPVTIPKSKANSVDFANGNDATSDTRQTSTRTSSEDAVAMSTPSSSESTPPTPSFLSRNVSGISGDDDEEWEAEQPLEKLTVFDLLGNLGVQQRLEQWQTTITAQKVKVKRHQERLKSTSANARQRAVDEVRRRLPTADEQLDRYRTGVKSSIDRLGNRWDDTATITQGEKLSFIAGVLNVFISGYLIGGRASTFYYWFTAQLCYFMPIRYHIYQKKGYHYFLADLCYFVNLLMLITIWMFPNSKRLFISTYCLAYGNNAIAIAMWRNSMVFHSLDKVTSLFIHIMPPVTLHTIVHLTPPDILQTRFPAVYNIKFSPHDSPEHYDLRSMIVWATVPYAVWQLCYHFLITVRARDKIAAGVRPTSFTWLRKSYANTWIGRLVLSLPDSLHSPVFMLLQYLYACLTIIPCPLWFWSRWASAAFLLSMFGWSVYNGATFYIDVFGKRFQTELENLKRDVAAWQNSPDQPPPVDATATATTTATDTMKRAATSPSATTTTSTTATATSNPNKTPEQKETPTHQPSDQREPTTSATTTTLPTSNTNTNTSRDEKGTS